jgi:hypothetical protein
MIFRDRIVLKNGTVIMPENIDRVEVVGRGRSTIVSYDVERKNTYSVIAEEGMFRTDRPTGMVDSTGKEIFERDRVVMDGKTGVVKFSDAAFDVAWDEQTVWGNEDGLWTVNARLTITGMVPFGEDK